MKSERRHELQHNDLAEWAVKTYESVSPYRNLIILLTVLVVVVAIALSVWHSHSEAQTVEAWNTVEVPESILSPVYVDQRYAAMMEEASNRYSDTSAGDWARVLAADSCLYLGETLLMTDKEQAVQRLNLAMERYEKSLNSANSMARERALFGKARILESTGKLAEATTAYQELNKAFPQGTYKVIADQRLEQLAKPDAVELYNAIAKYTPKPAAKESPRGKLDSLGSLPENPEEPALTPPVKPGAASSATGAGAPKSSAASSPAASKPEAPKSTAAQPAVPKPEAPKATAAEPVVPKPDAPSPTAAAPVAPKP